MVDHPQLEIADKRATKDERTKPADFIEDPKTTTTSGNVKTSGPSQVVEEGKYQLRARTVAIGNLDARTGPTVLAWAKAAGKLDTHAGAPVFPAPSGEAEKEHLPQDGCRRDHAYVTYHSVKEAIQAVKALHGRPLPNEEESDVLLAEGRVWARPLGGEGAQVKRWKVIVRNLPFRTGAPALRRIFAKHAFVWDVRLPKAPDGRARGFAFVTFLGKNDVEAAIQGVNGTKVGGRAMAVDWSESKHDWEDKKKQGQKRPREAEDGDTEDGDTEKQQRKHVRLGDDEGEGDVHGRDGDSSDGEEMEAEVDADIHEDEDDDEGQKERRIAEKVAGGILRHEDEQASDGRGERGSTTPATSTSTIRTTRGGGDGGGSGDDQKGRRRDVDVRQEVIPHTVFVRGLHLDTTFIGLQTRLSSFGEIRSCRVVRDKITGKSKGVAFVDFVTPAGAQAAVVASEAVMGGKNGAPLTVDGAIITCNHALTQDGARGLAEQITKKKEAAQDRDKRNLYLLEEGRILPGSSAWADMSDGDRAKRTRGEQDKKLKLKSPNFVLSKTRLSIRNIPYSWDEAQLREAVVAAVKARATRAKPAVRQAKLLYEEEKKGEDGAPRSKGMGFVELDEHEHALCALREMNNHPKLFGSGERRPIVEFAVENVKILKMREARGSGGDANAAESKKQAKWEAYKAKLAARKAAKLPKRKEGGKKDRGVEGDDGDGDAARMGKRKKETKMEDKQDKKQQQTKEANGVVEYGKKNMPVVKEGTRITEEEEEKKMKKKQTSKRLEDESGGGGEVGIAGKTKKQWARGDKKKANLAKKMTGVANGGVEKQKQKQKQKREGEGEGEGKGEEKKQKESLRREVSRTNTITSGSKAGKSSKPRTTKVKKGAAIMTAAPSDSTKERRRREQDAEEAVHTQRHQRAERELDAVLKSDDTSKGSTSHIKKQGARGRGQKEKHQEATLDSMVQTYTHKLFGGVALHAGHSKEAEGRRTRSGKATRWFD